MRLDYVENGCPSWEQLREMRDSGLVEIGSHSVGHPALTCLSLPEAKREIVMSKTVLEEKLGSRVLTFSYPYGALSRGVEDLVRQAGYTGAVGTVYRMGEFEPDDVFALNRVYVSKISRFPFVFRFMVSGDYVPARALALRLLNINAPRFADNCRVWKNYEIENLFKH